MDFITNNLPIVNSLALLIGIIFVIYRTFKDPDDENKTDIKNMELSCEYKHKRLDEIIAEMRSNFKIITDSIVMIKENDIKHIENEMRAISNAQTKILTILEYKEGIK